MRIEQKLFERIPKGILAIPIQSFYKKTNIVTFLSVIKAHQKDMSTKLVKILT